MPHSVPVLMIFFAVNSTWTNIYDMEGKKNSPFSKSNPPNFVIEKGTHGDLVGYVVEPGNVHIGVKPPFYHTGDEESEKEGDWHLLLHPNTVVDDFVEDPLRKIHAFMAGKLER